MLRVSLATLVSLFVFLTGCSSSGGGKSYADLAAEGQTLIARFQSQGPTPLGSMPTGSAVYNGVAAISTQTFNVNSAIANPEALGTVTLNANFDAGSISGSMANFVGRDDSSFGGSINLNNGSISGNAFGSDLVGQANVSGQNVNIIGDLAGVFVGTAAQGIYAEFNGFGDGVPFAGAIGAER